MNYRQFSAAFGFSVWLVATLMFRYWGHAFFIIDESVILISLFVVTVPVLYFLVQWVFHKFHLTGGERLRSAVLMAVPGMLCDVACLKFHCIVFPQMTLEQSVVLGAWVIWAYAIVLFIGLWKSQKAKVKEHRSVLREGVFAGD